MRHLPSIAVALLIFGTSAAVAQGYDNDRNRGNGAQERGDQDHHDNDNGRDYRYQNEANDRDHVRDAPHWSRGDHLPAQYRRDDYVVSDWKARHLKAPPRGYHWVKADDRYVLAAVASGLIADIIINSQH